MGGDINFPIQHLAADAGIGDRACPASQKVHIALTAAIRVQLPIFLSHMINFIGSCHMSIKNVL